MKIKAPTLGGEKLFSVQVFYNQEKDDKGRSLGMVRGYEDGDQLAKVVTLNVTAETVSERDPYRIADGVYRQMNHVDGTELIASRPLRSMSVGDVVIISDADGKVAEFAVDDIGWKDLS